MKVCSGEFVRQNRPQEMWGYFTREELSIEGFFCGGREFSMKEEPALFEKLLEIKFF